MYKLLKSIKSFQMLWSQMYCPVSMDHSVQCVPRTTLVRLPDFDNFCKSFAERVSCQMVIYFPSHLSNVSALGSAETLLSGGGKLPLDSVLLPHKHFCQKSKSVDGCWCYSYSMTYQRLFSGTPCTSSFNVHHVSKNNDNILYFFKMNRF